MTTKKKRIFLGEGTLTWSRGERISDRYGTVYLLEPEKDASEGASGLKEAKAIPLSEEAIKAVEGRRGTLYARVLKTRKSLHIGDLFRGVYPETPALNETIELGTGTFFAESEPETGLVIGLKPDDGRGTDWLEIKALYRAHSQDVSLYFETD
jgi:hypothetical protein